MPLCVFSRLPWHFYTAFRMPSLLLSKEPGSCCFWHLLYGCDMVFVCVRARPAL